MCDVCPPEAFTSITNSGQTLLHIACEQQDLDAVQIVLSSPLTDINVRDNARLSPLATAIQKCNPGLVRLLMKHGARLTSKHESELHRVWLAIASHFITEMTEDQTNMLNILQLVSQTTPELLGMKVRGSTLLHVAANHGSTRLTQLLLRTGVDVSIKASGKNGQTALHLAANEGHGDTVRWLTSFGARKISLDDSGMTPTHYMKTKEAMLAMEPGPQHFQIYDRMGRTPLISALARGATEVVAYLLQNASFLTDSLRKWASLAISSQWQRDFDRLEKANDRERGSYGVVILPFNISMAMFRVLEKYGITVGISTDADRPVDYRIARAAESQASATRRKDLWHWIPPPVSRCGSAISLAPSDTDHLFQLDPDSEQAVREMRIEADDEQQVSWLEV